MSNDVSVLYYKKLKNKNSLKEKNYKINIHKLNNY